MKTYTFSVSPHRTQDHGPCEAHGVIQRQTHPDRTAIHTEIPGNPQSPDSQVVGDAVVPVLLECTFNDFIIHLERVSTLNGLLEDVKYREVEESVMEEVVVDNLLDEIDLARRVLQFIFPWGVGKTDRIRAQLREQSYVDKPLHSPEIEAPKGDEHSVPLPIDFSPVALALTDLH